MSEITTKRVWDIPVRLFHWLLVGLVAVSIYTGENGGFKEMDYHMLSGYAILALISFRIVWGFVGSRHARFIDFISPLQIWPYLKSLIGRGPKVEFVGHNPLGGLSVVAILLVLAMLAGTGLFANDDIFLEGPLTHLVDDDTSDDLTSIHHLGGEILYVLIGLHLLAIIFYELVRQERLIMAMLHGKKRVSEGTTTDEQPNLVRELVSSASLMAVSAGAVYYLINHV